MLRFARDLWGIFARILLMRQKSSKTTLLSRISLHLYGRSWSGRYTIYLIRNKLKEEAAGVFIAEGHSKDSLLSFVNYALSFNEIQSLLDYDKARSQVVTVAASEDDQLVGFGSRANNTWREIWDSRDDGYADFILNKRCASGTKMHKLQQYLQKKLPSPSGSSLMSHKSNAPAEAMGGSCFSFV